jgi:hypothetical protein
LFQAVFLLTAQELTELDMVPCCASGE